MKKQILLNFTLLITILNTQFINTFDQSNLNQDLIKNPLNALNQAYQTVKICVENTKHLHNPLTYKGSFDAYAEEFNKAMRHYEKQCPFFFLGECTAEGWGPCLLSRSHEPSFRNQFEQQTVSTLEANIKKNNNKQPVYYTSFACGGMFQDFVIITKTLAKNPQAHIIINLIDTKFQQYVLLRNLCDNGREITMMTNTRFDNKQELLINTVRPLLENDDKSTDEHILTGANYQCLEFETTCKQFIGTLQKMFPNATLHLVIHDSTQNYLTYLANKNQPHADVIVAADMEDEMSRMHNASWNFAKLCLETLTIKPTAKTLYLAKKEYTKAVIRSLSLSKNNNDSAEEFENDDAHKTKTAFYINDKELTPSFSLITYFMNFIKK